MIKKIFKLIILMISITAFSQTNRFFYEYKFIPDANNRSEVLTEMMVLDVNKSGSKYYSHSKFISDSTMNADLEKQLRNSPNNITIKKNDKNMKFGDKIIKYYPEYSMDHFTNILADSYVIKEDAKPIWNILSDKEKIGEYNTQKATTKYGGREWEAWFTTDISIQDGPYKFCGLPGLIVKIEDKTNSHIMTLVANKKIQEVKEKETELPGGIKIAGIMGNNDIKVTKEQFKKVWKNYKNDPAKGLRQMMSNNSDTQKVILKSQTADGREITDPNAIYRDIEKKTKEKLSKNNNPIEPDLF